MEMVGDQDQHSKLDFLQIHVAQENQYFWTEYHKQLNLETKIKNLKKQTDKSIEAHTWGKQIVIPPRIALGGLKVACRKHTLLIEREIIKFS